MPKIPKRLILIVLTLAALALACNPTTNALPSITEINTEASEDWYTVYFSDPFGPNATTQRNGPDAALAEAIDQAKVSIDAALYDLNLWSIRDALKDAHRRGVLVRVVVESDNMDRAEVQALIDAGIEVLGDRRESLMHNKFIVIDRYEVWTGSMNLTLQGAYHHNNNLIRIRSSRLAENFLTEFEEMFTLDLFGQSVKASTPHPSLTIEGTQVETYFSPDDGTQAHIVALIQGAEESIYILAFAFTADPISEAVLDAFQRGVLVSMVIDEGQADNPGSDVADLISAGLDLLLDGNPDKMHHKVIIIDREIVILGSYNFSRSAEDSNDENTLVIHNAELAELFLEEFSRIYSIGVSP